MLFLCFYFHGEVAVASSHLFSYLPLCCGYLCSSFLFTLVVLVSKSSLLSCCVFHCCITTFFVQCLMISFSLVVVLMVEGFCSSKDDVWSSAIVTCRTVSVTDKVRNTRFTFPLLFC